MTEPQPVRPIDESRACQLALAMINDDPAAAQKVLQEAYDEKRMTQMLAAAVTAWVTTGIYFAGEESIIETLQAAIFDADLAQDNVRYLPGVVGPLG